jgi:cation:H+ antiporter
MLAIALLVDRTLSVRAAVLLLVLFFSQFVLSAVVPPALLGSELLILSAVYLALASVRLVRQRAALVTLLRDGLVTPYARMGDPRCGTSAGKLRLRVPVGASRGRTGD